MCNEFEEEIRQPEEAPQLPPQEPAAPRFEAPVPPPIRKKKGWTAGKVIALTLCCSLLSGLLGAGGLLAILLSGRATGPSVPAHMLAGIRENSVIDITKVDTSKLMTAAEVYAANVNSTVGITTSVTSTNFWGQTTTSGAAGSGFIITENGYILTNHHVIEGSSTITVSTYDGKSHKAALIGYDASNDIAVLKIDATGLSPVILGDSNNMNVGDQVIAIGNPLGELTFSLTSGSVSALSRDVVMSNGLTMSLLQTDCAINSGNSGGALFNMYGEVIGVTNAKYSTSSSSSASIDNIGFAIPVNSIQKIVQSIIEKGYISKPFLGVSVSDVSQQAQNLGLPKGAAVVSVVEDGPAEKAGVKANDIITHINGKVISGREDLGDFMDNAEIGQILNLTIYRKGQTLELTVTVGEQIQSAGN